MTEVERPLAHSRRAALGQTAQAARNRARRTAARHARTDQNHRRPASLTRESADVSAPTARSSRDAGGDWPLPRARSSCKLVPPGRGVRLEQDSRAGCSAQPRAIGRVRVAGTGRAIRLTAPCRLYEEGGVVNGVDAVGVVAFQAVGGGERRSSLYGLLGGRTRRHWRPAPGAQVQKGLSGVQTKSGASPGRE